MKAWILLPGTWGHKDCGSIPCSLPPAVCFSPGKVYCQHHGQGAIRVRRLHGSGWKCPSPPIPLAELHWWKKQKERFCYLPFPTAVSWPIWLLVQASPSGSWDPRINFFRVGKGYWRREMWARSEIICLPLMGHQVQSIALNAIETSSRQNWIFRIKISKQPPRIFTKHECRGLKMLLGLALQPLSGFHISLGDYKKKQ